LIHRNNSEIKGNKIEKLRSLNSNLRTKRMLPKLRSTQT